MGTLTRLLMVGKVKNDYWMLESQLNSLPTVLSTHALFIGASAKLKIVVYHDIDLQIRMLMLEPPNRSSEGLIHG